MASPESVQERSGDLETVTDAAPGARNDEGLPKSFDVLIVGTGLVESILSAAVSRNGHSVLHIDPREYYGGSWATFPLDQWTSSSFLETPSEAMEDVKIKLDDYQGTVQWRNPARTFEQVWYASDEETKEGLMKQKRRFNIDLMPKLVAAREDIVQLLITSNVSRYLEFLRVSKLLTNLPSPNEKTIESIPLSRADIFTSKSLSLVEKRSLVKLIETVMKQPKVAEEGESTPASSETEEVKEEIPETFEDLVKLSKVSDKLKHMIKASVAVLEDDLSSETFNQEFCSRCRLFLNSIGRYGNQTPFLWTLYGISEICQAFCRLSAVYGGIFILKRHLSSVSACEDGYIVKTEEDELKVKNIIFGPDLENNVGCEKSKKERSSIEIGRAVLITKGGNIKPPDENAKAKGDGIFVYRMSGIEVIEMNHNSQAVPKDYRLLQLSYPLLEVNGKPSVRSVIENRLSLFLDFEPAQSIPTVLEGNASGECSSAVEGISEKPTTSTPDQTKPQVIYGSYFILNYNCDRIRSEVYRNKNTSFTSCIMESAVSSSDISKYVAKAKDIFHSLYPEEEFLPKAPDNEDAEEMNGDDSFGVPAMDDNQENVNENLPATPELSEERVPDAET